MRDSLPKVDPPQVINGDSPAVSLQEIEAIGNERIEPAGLPEDVVTAEGESASLHQIKPPMMTLGSPSYCLLCAVEIATKFAKRTRPS